MEVDVKAEIAKTSQELDNLRGLLGLLDKDRAKLIAQITLKQGALLKLQELNGNKPEQIKEGEADAKGADPAPG